jgi:hypothetical protein
MALPSAAGSAFERHNLNLPHHADLLLPAVSARADYAHHAPHPQPATLTAWAHTNMCLLLSYQHTGLAPLLRHIRSGAGMWKWQPMQPERTCATTGTLVLHSRTRVKKLPCSPLHDPQQPTSWPGSRHPQTQYHPHVSAAASPTAWPRCRGLRLHVRMAWGWDLEISALECSSQHSAYSVERREGDCHVWAGVV